MVNKRCTYDDVMKVVIATNEGKRTVGLVPTDLFYYFFLSLRKVYKTDTNKTNTNYLYSE